MNDVTRTLKKLGLYYALLLVVNIFPYIGITDDKIFARNIYTIYFLILTACLILYYSYRVASPGGLKLMMNALA